MCDKDALRPTAKYWGVGVVRGSKGACKRTPSNPEGFNYTIRAEGLRAYLIVSDMWKRGLSGAKKHQWSRKFEAAASKFKLAKLDSHSSALVV